MRHGGRAGAEAAAKTAATSGPDYLHAALAASEQALEEMAVRVRVRVRVRVMVNLTLTLTLT